jgi:hypothetical protein
MARWTGGTFMRPPEWHRRRALQLEELVAAHGDRPTRSGILLVSELAVQHRNLARAIENRQRTGPVLFQVDSPPLSP